MATSLKPPAERFALKGHKPLSRTTIHGWPAILFGAVFVIIGSPILAIIGWMDYPQSSIHAPLWVIGVCGVLFAALGVWLIAHGTQGLHRQWNVSNGKHQLPDSPWLWDYAWQASGITDNTFKESLNSLIALGGFAVFLAPFNWIAFISDSG